MKLEQTDIDPLNEAIDAFEKHNNFQVNETERPVIVDPLSEQYKNIQATLDPKESKNGKRAVCSKALHPEFSYPLIQVAEMSLQKGYEPFNWLKKNTNVTTTYLLSAAQRHLDELKLGNDMNMEEKTPTGLDCSVTHHAACAAYNLLMLILQQRKGVAVDDRMFKDGKLIDKI